MKVRRGCTHLPTVSMIDPALFDKFEKLARLVRNSTKPFGGIQIVVTGDFFQLPPVSPGGNAQFVFESARWAEVVQHKFNLTQVFRQKDLAFVSMLNEMRFGRMSPQTVRAFSQLERTPSLPDGMVPTELFPLRRDVERANQMRLDAIHEELRTYTSLDGGTLQGEARERVLENFMASRFVYLKKGAQVMLIKNMDTTLVNGSIGQVIDFMDESTYEEKYGVDDDVTLTDFADRKLAQAERAPGASRSKQSERKSSPTRDEVLWPLVRFPVGHGARRDFLVRPETWTNEDQNGEVIASRTQIPLILAWAMSIHKSQGQTLACCRIDLRRVFEKGTYSACSNERRSSLCGTFACHVARHAPGAGVQSKPCTCLTNSSLLTRQVMAHPKVIRWSKEQFDVAPPQAK